MKPLIRVFVLLLGGTLVGCALSRTVPKRERIEVEVAAVDPKATVLHIEDFRGIGCGQVEQAFLATIHVISPPRYAGRELQIRLTAHGAMTVPRAADALTHAGAHLWLELSGGFLELASDRVADFTTGEVTIVEKPGQSSTQTQAFGRPG